MTAAALKRARLLTKVSICMVLLLCSALLYIGWWQTRHIGEVIESRGSAQAEITRMRHAAASLLDLGRVRSAFSHLVVASAGAMTETPAFKEGAENTVDEARSQLVSALDFLYVRWEAFDRSIAENGIGENARRFSAAMAAAIDAGDALVIASPETILETRTALDTALAHAMKTATNYYDAQKEVHVLAVSENEKLIGTMATAMRALLLVMCVISATAIWLWRAEVVAREKRKLAEQEAHFLAYNDALTGLPNRTRFYMDTDRILSHHLEATAFLIDIDEFKQVNDTYGHSAGDMLLKVTAQRLRESFEREQGAVARLGGDEFAAILPGIRSVEALDRFSEALLERCREQFVHAGRTIYPGMSIGLARTQVVEPCKPVRRDMLLKAADYALYRAKADGRNIYRHFDSETAKQVEMRREMRTAMPDALKNGEFFVEIQPQVRLDTLEPAGFEALVRWRRDGAVVPPGVFVEIAEESGFIADLDCWVLSEAIRIVSGFSIPESTELSVSVNMSAVHFRNDNIVARVAEILETSEFPAGRLILEITESVLIDDWEKTIAILDQLTALGVEIALDDFGTGYSSMSYLRRLRVSEIKIDRSFITDIVTSDETRMIFDSIVDMVRGLGMRLVVEGVETLEQVDILKELGGQYGQGYYFGRPMPAAEAEAWLEKSLAAGGARSQKKPVAGLV